MLTVLGIVQSVSLSGSPNAPFTEHFYIWNKFLIYQKSKGHSPYIFIGRVPKVAAKKYANPIKTAMQYQQMLDSGEVESRADLAQLLGVSRAKVTQMLNLLKLDSSIIEFMVGLDDTDKRLEILTERRLRSIAGIKDVQTQNEEFGNIKMQTTC